MLDSSCATLILWMLFAKCIGGQNIGLQRTSDSSAALRDPLSAKLALGGMIHAMLSMQIRPQGGFYEEKYNGIFPPEEETNFEKYYRNFEIGGYINSTRTASSGRLAEDGKLLEAASMGLRDTPCFEIERVSQNRLLQLLCSMRIQKEFQPKEME